jgi:tripartite-type tricarboxylate transporter receptor subunit TctC
MTLVRLAGLLLSLWTAGGFAQDRYPAKPVNVIIPFPPGGALDIGIRILQPVLSAKLGTTLVLINRPGAGGAVGLDVVAKAPADGYTVAATSTSTLTVVPVTAPNLPYKITDFAPVGNYATDASVLVVHSDTPWKAYEDLIDFARRNPGKLSYGSPGVGTLSALNMESLKAAYDVNIVQVPFPGTPQVRTALLGKHVDVGVMSFSGVAGDLRSGVLRALITSATSRLPGIPDVPTLKEKKAPQASLNLDLGLFVRAGTPEDIVRALSRALQETVSDTSVVAALGKSGMLVQYEGPESVKRQLQAEYRDAMDLASKMKGQK